MNRNNKRRKNDLFKPKKHLGSGTFGRVEKALSKLNGNTYALKLIENVDLLYLDSFEAEAEAMMRAKSDYTVELLDHFFDEELITYVFVMPYYSKGSLQDHVSENSKRWDKLDILCFLYQICQAFLSFSQQGGGCWHLDLKPDNILIKAEGEYSICDFGCAKLVDNINNSRYL
jgi:serine/threonine protein kinase